MDGRTDGKGGKQVRICLLFSAVKQPLRYRFGTIGTINVRVLPRELAEREAEIHARL